MVGFSHFISKIYFPIFHPDKVNLIESSLLYYNNVAINVKTEIFNLLTICSKQNDFEFNNKIYPS